MTDYYAKNSTVIFANLGIPVGAKVSKAYIRFTRIIARRDNDDYLKLNISGLSPSSTVAQLPTSYARTYDAEYFSIADLERTEHAVLWEMDPTPEVDGTADSPDISCILNELIALPSWTSANDVTLFFENLWPRSGDDLMGGTMVLYYWYAYEYSENGSEGVVCGGAAPAGLYFADDMLGGVVASGDSDNTQVCDEVSRGGILLNGAADVEHHSDTKGAFVVLDGAAEVETIYSPPSIGGVLIGATAQYGFAFDENGNGGILIGGLSDVEALVPTHTYVLVGGSADVTASSTAEATGGLVLCRGVTYGQVTLVVPAGTVGSELRNFPARFRVTLPSGAVEQFKVFDEDDEHQEPYYVMAYSDGGDLDIIVRMTLRPDRDNLAYLLYEVADL